MLPTRVKMSDSRSSALFKRAEQLKRWEKSDTNKQSAVPKRSSRVQFSPGIVFLAACGAGDKDEVQKLLHKGADINTANVDGLTALHQACIDDNMDMVEFLVNNGADVNRGDNEGWTPLHATASCSFMSIARYLIENGARVDAVNHDGELPMDISDTEDMGNMLEDILHKKGINCEKARNAEADSLLSDARTWAANGYVDVRDPKTGGTPLHVAAAKGYVQVAQILLEECLLMPDCLDDDGWTPLHAASLWGQQEAISLLLKYGADPLKKNYSGQTCADLVDPNLANWLSKTIANNPVNNNNDKRIQNSTHGDGLQTKLIQVTAQMEPASAVPIVNDKPPAAPEIIKPSDGKPPKARAPSPEAENAPAADEPPSWRRSVSFRRQPETPRENNKSANAVDDTTLRRTHSFENDKTFYQRYRDVTARIKATSCPSILPLSQTPDKKAAATNNDAKTNVDVQNRLYPVERKDREANTWNPPTTGSVTTSVGTVNQSTVRSSSAESDSNSSNSTPSAATPTKLSPGNIFKNFFKSFVPPVRDEESETQRKAHAKRVRETRRSTQGVTLDEIKSAEQLVKKKTGNGTPEPPSPDNNKKTEVTLPIVPSARKSGEVAVTLALASASATATATIAANSERRPSWRLRLDPANKFELEDVPSRNAIATVTLPLRRPPDGCTSNTTNKEESEKKDDRDSSLENKTSLNTTAGSTQSALNLIQRRRRPKRRSTGFGNVDMDEINSAGNSKDDGNNDTAMDLVGNNTDGELPLHGGEKDPHKSGYGSLDVNKDGVQVSPSKQLYLSFV